MTNFRIAGSALALSMILSTGALAQQAQQGQSSGTTSGPATGTNVEPSAATQKKAGTKDAAAVSAGAPGTAAAKGSESGKAPKS